MAPTLRTLSPVVSRVEDKTPRPRSPPYPSPPSEELNPIEKHQSKARPPSPRPSSPKPRVEPESSSKAASQPTPAAPAPAQEQDEDEDDDQPNRDDIMDMEIFGQLLELDEDDPEFTKDMVLAYFSQAETTFKDLDAALSKNDLEKLSALGHYFKGSSAALGVKHVQEHCERIQHYGALRDEEVGRDLAASEALNLITKELSRVKKDYRVAEKWLREYYKEDDS